MKMRLLSLLMAAVLLATVVVPAYAAEPDASSGGQGPESSASAEKAEEKEDSKDKEEAPEEKPETPADEWGGLAPPARPEEDETELPSGLEAGEVIAGVSLEQNRHIAYVLGDGRAMASFNPWREVTRAELAVMLSRLVPADAAVSSTHFTDVPASSWCYSAVSTMAGLGVMRAGETEFQPDEKVTRGEFLRYLASFFPLRTDARQFPDVPASSPDAPFILSARAYGWTQGGKDGLFKPDDPIARYEVVVMINRALNRKADQEYIGRTHPAFYIDVSPETWFYYDVMEASVHHEHTDGDGGEQWTAHSAREKTPAEGFQLVNGWLYYYSSARGDVVRSDTVEGHTFNTAGRFTSGNTELDNKLHSIVLKKVNSNMTQEQMLRALYVYTRDSFTYLRRPAYPFGSTGFMVEDALRMLNSGYGNCYCYASLFWFLSRWVGYDSRIFSGTVGQNRAPHSWVEITMDGVSYIFDTELEMAYRRKGRYDVNLYKFHDAKNSWRYVRP